MKSIVIYTSKSGNTKKIAEAVASELSCKAINFVDASELNLSEFDFIALGYYIDQGSPEKEFKKFITQNVKDKKMGFFITLGADVPSAHATQAIEQGRELFAQNGNEVLRTFICQGAIATEVIEQLKKLGKAMPDDPRFALTPERLERWERAKTHPDETDIKAAKGAFRGVEI
ncbi:flavodoxin family protein [Campylobacter concisus]|uniref:flavodoxin family protein n=1 Tax=Campylobacter concisus TaxID=199 RepID=UPI000D30DEA9|nr:flavodoxin family protein [Campylobacter concisus]